LEKVQELRKWEERLFAADKRELEDMNLKLFKLESQLNALVSAAAAVGQPPKDHHNNLLKMVSSAIGEQAHAADVVERVGMKVRNVNGRITRARRRA
jgi:hypothetical protein